MTEHATLPLPELIFDFTLYPRHDVDGTHVNEMVEALVVGTTLPPPIVDTASKRVVDGFHRVTAHRKRDPEQSIEVELRSYPSDRELFADAVRLNAPHGRKFSNWDRIRCIQKLKELGVEAEERASLLNITVDRAEKLAGRTAKSNGTSEPLKATMRHLSGKRLTKKQAAALKHAGGMNQTYYVNQLINLIEGDALDLESPQLMERLAYLTGLLNQLGVAAA